MFINGGDVSVGGVSFNDDDVSFNVVCGCDDCVSVFVLVLVWWFFCLM